jgi:hypothetical protein
MKVGRKLALVAGAAMLASAAMAQPAGQKVTSQKVTGPIAVYWMSAATQSGFGAGMMGGGGRPSASAIMNAMRGGGQAAKTLTLQLGSSQTNPAPAADHLPPQGLGAGPDLPLVTPKAAPAPTPAEPSEMPREFQRPKGKMLIFWGCGQHARPGQPLVIDFSLIDPAKGKMPPNFAAAMKGFNYRAMQPPSPSRNRTYGEWPNEKTRTQVPSNGSLVGEHTIRGNYSPEIHVTLAEDQDFLGPLNLTTNAKDPGGWVDLGWNLVPNAQAYLATAMGGGQDTVVMWTSSEVQAAAFAMPDYLSTGEIARLVQQKALMGPTTKTCQVPKEVLDATPQGILQLVAYGGEANFVYPPRPADPKVAWNRQWEVKVRYRSATGGLLGMTMPGMPDAGAAPSREGQASQPGQPQPRPAPRRPSAADILRGGLPIPGIPHFPH